jgi:hypothetical protein
MAYVAKTRQTDADVDAFLARAEPAARREDGRVLCELMGRVSGEQPKMWGPTIVGFGVRAFSYASGRSGQICRIGFSPRKPALVLYLPDSPDRAALLSGLGKHSHGVGCLYIKRLAEVDPGVLEQLVRSSWAAGAQPLG